MSEQEIRDGVPIGATHGLMSSMTKRVIYLDVRNSLIMTKKGWCAIHIGAVLLSRLKPL